MIAFFAAVNFDHLGARAPHPETHNLAQFAKPDSAMANDSPSLDDLTKRLLAFRDARDWRQFHSLKDLILSLNLEASELLELTQWKPAEEFESEAEADPLRQRLAEECADVLLYLLLIAERVGLDLQAAAADKIAMNAKKYPIQKARGTATKYTDL